MAEGCATVARLAVVALVAGLSGPVAADAGGGPDAALAVCAAPVLTLSERVAGLTDAGWLQAAPSDAVRDRAALVEVAEPLFQGRPLAGAGVGSLSDQFQRARDRRQPVMPAPGTPVDAGSISQAIAGGASIWAGTLSSTDVDGDLVLLVSPERSSTTAVTFECRFFLGAPVPVTALDALIPEGLAPGSDRQGGGPPGATLRMVSLSPGDGAALRLTLADLTTAPEFAALTSEVGAVAPLSALLTTHLSNVPLR